MGIFKVMTQSDAIIMLSNLQNDRKKIMNVNIMSFRIEIYLRGKYLSMSIHITDIQVAFSSVFQYFMTMSDATVTVHQNDTQLLHILYVRVLLQLFTFTIQMKSTRKSKNNYKILIFCVVTLRTIHSVSDLA